MSQFVERSPDVLFVRGLDGGDMPQADAGDEEDKDQDRESTAVETLLEGLRQTVRQGPSAGAAAVRAHWDLIRVAEVLPQLVALAEVDQTDCEGKEGWVQLLELVRAEQRRRLTAASDKLHALLGAAGGNVRKLEAEVLRGVGDGEIDDTFMHMLAVNTNAARDKGQAVRVKVYERLAVVIREAMMGSKAGSGARAGGGAGGGCKERTAEGGKGFEDGREWSRSHAPVLRPAVAGGSTTEAVTSSTVAKPAIDGQFFAALDCADGGAAADAQGSSAKAVGGKNKKRGGKKLKKEKKKGTKKAGGILGGAMAEELQARGWATCDNFLTAKQVVSVRMELHALQPHFRASEIWVGADSDVGAQITVPSVRGDRVLWMCGAHQRAAGVVETREVQTHGTMEPCDQGLASFAAKRPLSHSAKGGGAVVRFGALRRVVQAIEDLVFHNVCGAVGRLSGLCERSDVMCAVYDGGGARFQRHIDNTAKDGRKLTVLCYLNPRWSEADGGALRVHPPPLGSKASGSDDGRGREAVDLFPEGGRLVMFYSDVIPHEVLPSHAPRHALTVWFYDRAERDSMVEAAVTDGRSEMAAAAGAKAQAEAKAFIAALLQHSDASASAMAEFARDACAKLSVPSVAIVSAVLGWGHGKLSTPAEMSRALAELKPHDLSQLCAGLQSMGI